MKDTADDKEETVIVTMRCADLASPIVGSAIVPCTDCGELTWSQQKKRSKDTITT